jgi:hypothetical protein
VKFITLSRDALTIQKAQSALGDDSERTSHGGIFDLIVTQVDSKLGAAPIGCTAKLF